jgi:hypothetical protein
MDKAAKPRMFFFSFFEKLMVPPIKRNASTKQASFLQKRKERLKLEDPEHFTIAQLKAMLRAANVSKLQDYRKVHAHWTLASPA